jgi:hypothetical protein
MRNAGWGASIPDKGKGALWANELGKCVFSNRDIGILHKIV